MQIEKVGEGLCSLETPLQLGFFYFIVQQVRGFFIFFELETC